MQSTAGPVFKAAAHWFMALQRCVMCCWIAEKVNPQVVSGSIVTCNLNCAEGESGGEI